MFRCSITCCFLTSFPYKLEQWISSLGKLHIETLVLRFVCCSSRSSFLSKFYDSSSTNHEIITFRCGLISQVPSLKILRLTGCLLQSSSSGIQPNLLNAVELVKVSLDSATVDCILSNCLHLEKLLMGHCTIHDSSLRICGSNLRLKSLCIKFCSEFEEIELRADNLQEFEYFATEPTKFYFVNVPKLVTLSLTHSSDFSCGELARVLPSVICLTLQIDDQYYEMSTPARFNIFFTPDGFNMFRNVRWLRLGFSMFKLDQLSVASILEMCPLLCEFHLQTEKLSPTLKGQQAMKSLKYHHNLEKVIFSGFSGTQCELDAAKYILGSAKMLKQMIISYCFSCYQPTGNGQVPTSEQKREMIEKQLGKYSTSKDVKITVQPICVSDMNL